MPKTPTFQPLVRNALEPAYAAAEQLVDRSAMLATALDVYSRQPAGGLDAGSLAYLSRTSAELQQLVATITAEVTAGAAAMLPAAGGA